MLSRRVINASKILKHNYLSHDRYLEQYARDEYFKDAYEALIHGNQNEELDYHVHNGLLYHLGKLYILGDERVDVIREAHTSLIFGHFW